MNTNFKNVDILKI